MTTTFYCKKQGIKIRALSHRMAIIKANKKFKNKKTKCKYAPYLK